jgi:hypothetical protein
MIVSLWGIAKDKLVSDRLLDEELHELAYREIESGARRDGLWAKAIVEGRGDAAATKIIYLRLLVQRLRDERYVVKQVAEAHRDQQQRHTAAQHLGETARPRQAEAPKPMPKKCFYCEYYVSGGIWDKSKGRCTFHEKKVYASDTCASFSYAAKTNN